MQSDKDPQKLSIEGRGRGDYLNIRNFVRHAADVFKFLAEHNQPKESL